MFIVSIFCWAGCRTLTILCPNKSNFFRNCFFVGWLKRRKDIFYIIKFYLYLIFYFMFIVSILYFIFFYIIVYYIILSYIYFISTLQQNHIILLSFIIFILNLYVYSYNIILPSLMTQYSFNIILPSLMTQQI